LTDLVKGIFRSRPNRFIVEVELDGEIVRAHLPNTGRCKELLIDGATVYLKPSDNPNRKTKYSLYLKKVRNLTVPKARFQCAEPWSSTKLFREPPKEYRRQATSDRFWQNCFLPSENDRTKKGKVNVNG
jgi:hypothetical protein